VELAGAFDRELRHSLAVDDVVMHGHRDVEESKAVGYAAGVVPRKYMQLMRPSYFRASPSPPSSRTSPAYFQA
jgi:hypothetical protein